jgi:nucleotide-binding universal stress UspA family protein
VIRFRNILCPTDLSDESLPSVTYAAALARWHTAQLTLLHVVPAFDPVMVRPGTLGGPVEFVTPASREEVIEALERVVETADAGGIQATCTVDAGDPSRRIVDQALTIPADLIVIGTHGRGGFERLMLGSVAEKVLRKSPCPVMTVPPHAVARRSADVRLEKILCAMDYSTSALQAFGFALDLAGQAEGSVTVMHAIEWLTDEDPQAHADFNASQYRQYLIDEARRRVRALIAAEPRRPRAVEDVVALGRPHREILRLATELPADLIVMGAQGRGGLGLALFGSTTQQVVRAAQCPVLTVRMSEVPHVA